MLGSKTKQAALDNLKDDVEATRHKGRIRDIKEAFIEYVEVLNVPWWKRLFWR